MRESEVVTELDHLTAEMECFICGHEWIAVYPVVAPRLECPGCSYMNPRHDQWLHMARDV